MKVGITMKHKLLLLVFMTYIYSTSTGKSDKDAEKSTLSITLECCNELKTHPIDFPGFFKCVFLIQPFFKKLNKATILNMSKVSHRFGCNFDQYSEVLNMLKDGEWDEKAFILLMNSLMSLTFTDKWKRLKAITKLRTWPQFWSKPYDDLYRFRFGGYRSMWKIAETPEMISYYEDYVEWLYNVPIKTFVSYDLFDDEGNVIATKSGFDVGCLQSDVKILIKYNLSREKLLTKEELFHVYNSLCLEIGAQIYGKPLKKFLKIQKMNDLEGSDIALILKYGMNAIKSVFEPKIQTGTNPQEDADDIVMYFKKCSRDKLCAENMMIGLEGIKKCGVSTKLFDQIHHDGNDHGYSRNEMNQVFYVLGNTVYNSALSKTYYEVFFILYKFYQDNNFNKVAKDVMNEIVQNYISRCWDLKDIGTFLNESLRNLKPEEIIPFIHSVQEKDLTKLLEIQEKLSNLRVTNIWNIIIGKRLQVGYNFVEELNKDIPQLRETMKAYFENPDCVPCDLRIIVLIASYSGGLKPVLSGAQLTQKLNYICVILSETKLNDDLEKSAMDWLTNKQEQEKVSELFEG